MTEVRALTVRQPWAWAIAHGGKDVENRTWGTRWRGLVGIHAGLTLDEHGSHDQRVLAARTALGLDIGRHWPADEPRGAFVAAAQLVGCHLAYGGCCDSPWGQRWAPDTSRQVQAAGLSFAQIAEVLGVSKQAIHQRYQRLNEVFGTGTQLRITQ